MIVGIEGVLQARGEGWAVVRVGGVSLRVLVPGSTLSSLGSPGEAVRLFTSLHVREDGWALYGFATQEERDLFELLLGVTGVGPKLALGMLSSSARELAVSIASASEERLTQLPGIGKKLASRLVLELQGKLQREWGAAAPPSVDRDSEVIAALTALGYTHSEARSALSALPPSGELPIEERVTLALQHLARGR